MFETILVAHDGSERASEAADVAVDLAVDHGAALHGIYVVDTTLLGEPALSTAELSVDAVEDRGHEILAGLADRADERGVSAATTIRHGAPKSEIVAYAEEVDADLVVVGAHGSNPGHRTGSVATHVFEHADCRVLKI